MPILWNRSTFCLSFVFFYLSFNPVASFLGHYDDIMRCKNPDRARNVSGSSHRQSPLMAIPSMSTEILFGLRAEEDETDLERRFKLFKSRGISHFVIANTGKKDRCVMSRRIESLRRMSNETSTDVHICAQYSLKHHPNLKAGLAEKKQDFLRTLEDAYIGADEILLVSGSDGPEPRAWKTIDAISALVDQTKLETRIAVGYNPYHSHPLDQDRENARLLAQLATGVVSRIYISFGTDLEKLKTGIDFCKNAAMTFISSKDDPSNHDGQSVSLVGSLFLPTPDRIAKQNSRRWKGVALDPDFKRDPTGQQACALVIEIVKIFRKHDIELFWETPGIRSLDDVHTMDKIVFGSLATNGDNVDQKHDLNVKKKDDLKRCAQKKSQRHNTNEMVSGSEDPCLLIFGSHDVRLRDNRAVEEAFKRHKQVLPVFLYTQEEREGPWGCPENTAAAVCLEEALKSLQVSLESFGLPLVYCNCTASESHRHGTVELLYMIEAIGAKAVYWNKEATPEGRARHTLWKDFIKTHDATIACYEGQSTLLYDVDKLKLKSGFQQGHFGTLMPFLKKCTKDFGLPSRPTPQYETFRLFADSKPPKLLTKLLSESSFPSSTISTKLCDLKIVAISGMQRWDDPIREQFPMSENRAHEEMALFVRNGMRRYEKERSRADKNGATSRLSPHLRIGTLSPNQLYWRIKDSGLSQELLKTISRRLIWRDLAYYHLFCFPDMRTHSIRRHYEQMEWVSGVGEEERRFEAWKKGMTGYPIVDAGMRELYATGWMTQSVRMVVASFLTEYLRVNWTYGCEWFHYTLVDADSAINAMMWQNAGRSGIDQWNFVLSPKTASQDPSGEYTKKWVPELARLPTADLIHRPWEATEEVLKDAGVILGHTYPHRIVTDLKRERERSVRRVLAMRKKSQEYNSDRGYDLIDLPNGQKSVVFTKKEYRIDDRGNLLTDNDTRGKKTGRQTKSGRSKKRQNTKATRNSGTLMLEHSIQMTCARSSS
mmetsp:Transcript_13405/g.31555  ORF Transcript_13405/g.31555 Transcript_13405/m.31555 type:complete len:996 (+) Transcript_13405:312-3299(+)